MSGPEIQPRMEDGVGWCDTSCEWCSWIPDADNFPLRCELDDENRVPGTICSFWAERMAAENKAWRSGRLKHRPLGGFLVLSLTGGCLSGHDTVEEAVDALLNETGGE